MEVFFRDGSNCFKFLDEDRVMFNKIIHLFDKENIEDTITSALIMRKKILKDYQDGSAYLKNKEYTKAGFEFG